MRFSVYFIPLLICCNIQGQVHTWDLLTRSNQPYSDIILDSLINDTLQVKVFDKIYKIPVDSITTLRRERESYTGTGILIGVTGGAILGASISGNSKSKGLIGDVGNAMEKISGLFFGSLLGGFFGGVVGTGLGKDEVYIFLKKNKNEKIEILKRIIRESNLSRKYSKEKHLRE